MESKDLQLRLLYPARLSFKTEGEIKSLPDKKKLKEVLITNQYVKKLALRRRKTKTKTEENK